MPDYIVQYQEIYHYEYRVTAASRDEAWDALDDVNPEETDHYIERGSIEEVEPGE